MISRRKFLGLVAAVPFLAPLLRAGCKAKCEANPVGEHSLVFFSKKKITLIPLDELKAKYPGYHFLDFGEWTGKALVEK